MHQGGKILTDMENLILLFIKTSTDPLPLQELLEMVREPNRWPDAHEHHSKIRNRTVNAEKREDSVATVQCLFEEICAKSIYNLSYEPAPFDSDSPYWIIPNAIAYANLLGLRRDEIIDIIA